MVNITLATALEDFAEEIGCTGGVEGRRKLIREVTRAIEWVLSHGGGDILREWVTTVRNGRFTFPRDLEVPIKFKFSKYADVGFGTVKSPFFSYGSNGISNCCGYQDWATKLEVKTNKVVTEFYPPKCGARIIATTREDLDVGKSLIVGGKQRGFPVVTTHEGYKIAGELLTIYKEDDPNKKYSSYQFDEIISVVKDLTCDYVMLSAMDEQGNLYHLGHYHPDDQVPTYTEGDIYTCSCWGSFGMGGCFSNGCDYSLHIIGKVNQSITYIRDEDIIPISSYELLKLMARKARYDGSGDYDTVTKIEDRMKDLIRTQVAYQKESTDQLSISLGASGITLTNA